MCWKVTVHRGIPIEKLWNEISASVSCMQAGIEYAWLAHGTAAGIVHILHVNV